MKRNLFLLTVIASLAILFTSCEKNHKKIAEKMLTDKEEPKCIELVQSVWDLVLEDKFYSWTGDKMELNISGDLKDSLDTLIAFHKEKHSFNESEWEDWMYYENNQTEESAGLHTECFLCKQKNKAQDKEKFDSDLVPSNAIIYASEYGNAVQTKEAWLTESHFTRYLMGFMSSYSTATIFIVDIKSGEFPKSRLTTDMNAVLQDGKVIDITHINSKTKSALKFFFNDYSIAQQIYMGNITLAYQKYNKRTDAEPLETEFINSIDEFLKYF